MCTAVQFIVYQRNELVQGRRLAQAPQAEQLSDLLRGTVFFHATSLPVKSHYLRNRPAIGDASNVRTSDLPYFYTAIILF
jgi:hypothetical protein